MNSQDFLHDIQVGLKGLSEFEVQVTVPPDFEFKGPVPFDLHIVRDQAFVTVKAESLEKAKQLAEEYFNGDLR